MWSLKLAFGWVFLTATLFVQLMWALDSASSIEGNLRSIYRKESLEGVTSCVHTRTQVELLNVVRYLCVKGRVRAGGMRFALEEQSYSLA